MLEMLGAFQPMLDAALSDLAAQNALARLWSHDHTLWKPDPREIRNRLGWLHSPEEMLGKLAQLTALVHSLQAEGYTRAVLLGMGGSSLAPEVFRKTFGVRAGYLDLNVLDSTDPDAILALEQSLDLGSTLFIVATKSGGTVETLSFFKYFYNQAAAELGESEVGRHFIAITDPGSRLVALAQRYQFRTTFLNNPNIGGRYSALSHFGLVPAALLGVDLPMLLERALAAARENAAEVPAARSPAMRLGAVLGEMAKAGRDKATLILSPEIESFGDWVEQLIAESTGKDGKGILPVVGEPLGAREVYGDDRLFIHLHLRDDETQLADVADLAQAGHPVLRIQYQDRYDMGGQFFLWELATAIAGHRLGIHPFDQPDVESAKALAREMVAAYKEDGSLPEMDPAPLSPSRLHAFLREAEQGAYVALQAYVQPTAEVQDALNLLRRAIRDHTHLATSMGFGPRFLHSTGQLHKGDGGNGLFIQFTADNRHDLPIPDEAGSERSSLTFNVLKTAQALGDQQALLRGGRRVLRFHLSEDAPHELQILAKSLT